MLLGRPTLEQYTIPQLESLKDQNMHATGINSTSHSSSSISSSIITSGESLTTVHK